MKMEYPLSHKLEMYFSETFGLPFDAALVNAEAVFKIVVAHVEEISLHTKKLNDLQEDLSRIISQAKNLQYRLTEAKEKMEELV